MSGQFPTLCDGFVFAYILAEKIAYFRAAPDVIFERGLEFNETTLLALFVLRFNNALSVLYFYESDIVLGLV